MFHILVQDEYKSELTDTNTLELPENTISGRNDDELDVTNARRLDERLENNGIRRRLLQTSETFNRHDIVRTSLYDLYN